MADTERTEKAKWNVYEEKDFAVQLNELERNDPIEALIVGKSQKNFSINPPRDESLD